MKLQTEIPLEKISKNLIDYNSNILLFGSCFVENIGEKFEYFKFQNLKNPFGILFHPLAIEGLVMNAVHEKVFSEEDIFFQNEQWHCYNAHSNLSDGSQSKVLDNLNAAIQSTSQKIQSATHIIITLGTAWVYRHYESNIAVANCHKVPQKEFVKSLLSIEQIEDALKLILIHIKKVNPTANFIFTVSPVRHTKDGFVENMQSKAHLISAIHNVLSDSKHPNCFYFPSYEIMMDELRDYRFYGEDMIHPNQTAINYIWNKFQKVWMSDETLKIMDEVDSIQKGLKHRPFNSNSGAHQKFIEQLRTKIEVLQTKFPHITY